MLTCLPVHVHLPFACKTKDTRETPPSSPLFEQGNIRSGDEARVWAKSYQQEAGVGAGTPHPGLRRLGESTHAHVLSRGHNRSVVDTTRDKGGRGDAPYPGLRGLGEARMLTFYLGATARVWLTQQEARAGAVTLPTPG